MTAAEQEHDEVWGPYASYDDVARVEYGRRLWRLREQGASLRAMAREIPPVFGSFFK